MSCLHVLSQLSSVTYGLALSLNLLPLLLETNQPSAEPPASPTGSWALFQGGTTTPTNTYAGSGTPGDTYSSEGGAREVSQDPDDAGRAVESIYDDNNLFVAWFEDP